jgi:hypothetical protein
LPAEGRLGDERPGDTVSDGVHPGESSGFAAT